MAGAGVREPSIYNLITDFRGLSDLLTERLEREPKAQLDTEGRLTVFFLAAGLHQIVEDYLHRVPDALARTEARFGSFGHPLATAVARAAKASADSIASVRIRRTPEREVLGWSMALGELLEASAAGVVDERRAAELGQVRSTWRSLSETAERLPKPLLASFPSLPNPFATFDQMPEDCRELMRRFAARWPDRERPILLIGIRTSGTYLAALYRAVLQDLGYRRVGMLTVRPGPRWRRGEVGMLRAVSDRGGLVLVADDPPTSGGTVAKTAQECLDHGAARSSIVVVLQLLGPSESLPEVLQPYPSVLLPWEQWAIQERLLPRSVKAALTGLLVGREIGRATGGTTRVRAVEEVERLEEVGLRHRSDRRHARALYRVRLVDEAGEQLVQQVFVRGTGLGYFAGYARGVASALSEYVPELYGAEDGLLYRAWLPGDWLAADSRAAGLEARIASYVLARREGLPVDAELAERATDDAVSWDLVADALGWALLHSLRILVFPLTWAAARRLTRVERPALIDGAMAASNWFVAPSSRLAESGLKVAADESAFANAAKLSYDVAVDLASAAASFEVEEMLRGGAGAGERPFPDRLLEAFTELSGETVDPERWLLYQLLYNRFELSQLRERGPRGGDVEGHVRRLLATERALAAAQQRYVAGVFLSDLAPPASGPVCAIDVDWTLETRWLDFPALMPTGAVALRALARHGFRPVIASGRSLEEVRRRCRTYRLAGGVAEYGAVAHDHLSGRTLPQLSPAQEAELDRLREQLRQMPGVYLDDTHAHSIRALRLTDGGERRGLSDEMIEEALAKTGLEPSMQVFYGGLQTDFAPVSVTKGTGLRTLVRALGGDWEADQPLAFAMGDDSPDAPMLELAKQRFAPGNASPDLREELSSSLDLRAVHGRQGAGLLEAVKLFLGHDPRRCETCAVPRLPARTKLVTIPLAATDGPRSERLRQALALAALLARARAESALRSRRAPR